MLYSPVRRIGAVCVSETLVVDHPAKVQPIVLQLVEGVAVETKHTKASQQNPQGGIVKQEAFIDSSNVMYVHKGKATRIGFTTVDGKNGPKKVRVAKSTGEVID